MCGEKRLIRGDRGKAKGAGWGGRLKKGGGVSSEGKRGRGRDGRCVWRGGRG